jgi:hypothetical protein
MVSVTHNQEKSKCGGMEAWDVLTRRLLLSSGR